MHFSYAVKNILITTINEVARDPRKYAARPGRDFTRNRKLGLKKLFLLLLTMEADCVREELYRFFGRNTDSPSKAAFYKQRQNLTKDALANLLYLFNAKLTRKLYNGKYQLIACDGSSADIFRNPDDPDTFYESNGKSTRGFNLIHINCFYSILDRRYTDLVVQPGRRQNEYAAFCSMVDAAGNGGSPTIYIADRGYASYNNFAHVVENGQFFLIRCDDKKLKGILGHSVEGIGDTDCRVERILTRSHSKKKRLHPDRPGDYRYVYPEVPMDYINERDTEYSISLRIVRFELSPRCFENIITNLPEQEFASGDFKDLYFLRWKEENSFRDLKYPLCLKAFHAKKYDYIVQEVWARAILHNFSTAIICEVVIAKGDTKHEYQVNFAEGFKICRDFLRMGDEGGMDVEGLIAQNIEAVRPGRTFARQHGFKRPFSFCYRN